jgi:hypothetical protein
VLANPAVVLADLEIEAHRENRVGLESPVILVCPESRIDRETAVQEELDPHNDTLGTLKWSFTSIRLNVIGYEIWTQRVSARKAFILENRYISEYGDISTKFIVLSPNIGIYRRYLQFYLRR